MSEIVLEQFSASFVNLVLCWCIKILFCRWKRVFFVLNNLHDYINVLFKKFIAGSNAKIVRADSIYLQWKFGRRYIQIKKKYCFWNFLVVECLILLKLNMSYFVVSALCDSKVEENTVKTEFSSPRFDLKKVIIYTKKSTIFYRSTVLR